MNRLLNLALVVATVVVCLVATEIALRVVDGVRLWPLENLILQRVDLVRVHLRNQFDPLLGWIPRENLSMGQEPGETYTTGRYGMRMPVPGVIRPIPHNAILAVGDSFTAGAEVGDRHTWPAFLERMLGEPVNNPSPGGWATDQIVLRAESLLDEIKPRTVIVDFLVDDIERAGYEIYGGGAKPYFVVRDGELVHRNNPVPRHDGRVQDVGVARALLGYSHLVNWTMARVGRTEWFNDPGLFYKKVDNNPVAVSCLLLRRLKGRTDAMGIRLLFVMQYGGLAIDRGAAAPDAARQVLSCAQAAGIQTADTWAPLKAIAVSDPRRFASLFVGGNISRHMSPAGNELIAGLIAAAYRQPQAAR